MQQEINLCLLLPQQKKSFLNLRLLGIASAGLIALLFLHVLFGYWGKHREVLAVNEQNEELAKVEKSLALLHERYPMLDPKDLENSLKKLQSELEEENHLFSLLAPNRNFSNYLLGIAKAAVPNLWLVDIQANPGEGQLTMKGYALDAKAIEAFMNHLPVQTEFAGQNFELREMTQTELEKESVLHFIISTRGEDETKTG